ncbi:cytochrome P450 [Streptacidiphilus sp. PB12-B1b]|uniref:cytochrome P450 n=1 Tax=Streptacidiphilus sp. PB12-B1b TaxID=2705012 RepID=UPI0015FB9BED|nr:cytochrome P450 [Streptacidiphilus sp. PB12-B1b]QMU78155.1 cytochrome P450 [Streptacidiphilus sp. PB12-B1b]
MSTSPEPLAFPFGDPPGLAVEAEFQRLRDTPGLCPVQLPYGGPAFLAVRHQDVKSLLTDPRFSRAESVGPDEPRLLPIVQRANLLMASDGPEHDRLRRRLAAAFTVRGVERLRPRTEAIVGELLDGVEKHGAPADLMELFALPLPILMICELLGVPPKDRLRFRELAESFLAAKLHQLTAQQIGQAGQELRGYLVGLVAGRHHDPGDDLLSTLVTEAELSDEELVGIAVTILIAGHEVLADQLANFSYFLLTHPGHHRRLLDSPELIPSAVEEMLRHTPLGVSTGSPRRATEDVELGGITVRAGEYVLPVMTSANRDASVFDAPEEVDFDRRTNPHLGFGYGVHRCLGSALARMELQVGMGALLQRLPSLRLAVPAEEITWCTGGLVRGPQALPVAW